LVVTCSICNNKTVITFFFMYQHLFVWGLKVEISNLALCLDSAVGSDNYFWHLTLQSSMT
jgi:hypothetical protein